jgi:hypothetical protein
MIRDAYISKSVDAVQKNPTPDQISQEWGPIHGWVFDSVRFNF